MWHPQKLWPFFESRRGLITGKDGFVRSATVIYRLTGVCWTAWREYIGDSDRADASVNNVCIISVLT